MSLILLPIITPWEDNLGGIGMPSLQFGWVRAQTIYQNGLQVATLASPVFTGIPAGPTAAPGTNTTQLATTAFVTAATGAEVDLAQLIGATATQRILARNTAGAGDWEESTITQLLDWLGAAQGSILYRGAAGWAVLVPGTSGQILQTGGAGANPAWANYLGANSVALSALVDATTDERLLGATTAGPFGELSASAVLDWLGGAAHGDSLARGASDWELVAAPGTPGNYYWKHDGTAAKGSWAPYTSTVPTTANIWPIVSPFFTATSSIGWDVTTENQAKARILVATNGGLAGSASVATGLSYTNLTAESAPVGADLVAFWDQSAIGGAAIRSCTVTEFAAVVGSAATVFADDVFRVQDDGDATKQVAFQASGITTGTTRTITMPDADVDLTASGTGNIVRVTSATLVTPDLGTPSAAVLTNATGLPTTGLVDDAVTLAKMAAGTAGNLITYDASGDPAAVVTGTATHVLTSNGAGAAPTFQAPGGGSTSEAAYTVTLTNRSGGALGAVDQLTAVQTDASGGADGFNTCQASDGGQFIGLIYGEVADAGTTTVYLPGSVIDGIDTTSFTGSISLFIPDVAGDPLATSPGLNAYAVAQLREDHATTGAVIVTAIRSLGASPQFTTIELGHATDTTLARAAAGIVSVEGVRLASVVRYVDWPVPAGAWTPAATDGAAPAVTVYSGNDIDTYAFDATTEEAVYHTFRLPLDYGGGVIRWAVDWDALATASGTVVWGLSGGSFTNSDALTTALGTERTATDTLITVGGVHQITDGTGVTLAGTPAAGEFVILKLVAKTSGTIAVDVLLINVQLQYQTATTAPAVFY